MSFEASIEAGKYFNKFFGIKTGLGYSYFSSSLTMSSLSKQVNTVDTDGDQLIVNETGSRIQEKQNASYIDLPIIFLVKLPFNHFSGFFFNAGINLSLNSSNNYSSSGIYTVTGILPAYNTVLQNQPDYGFYTNQNLTYNGSLKISKLTESFTLSPGYFLNSGNSCFEFGFLFKLWLTKYSIPNAPAYDVNNAKFNSGSLLTNSKFWFQTAGIQLRYSYFY